MQSKDPGVAMVIQAVVPGAGYLYLGSVQQAIGAWIGIAFMGFLGFAFIQAGPSLAVWGYLLMFVVWVLFIADAGREARKLARQRNSEDADRGEPSSTSPVVSVKCPKCGETSEFKPGDKKVCWTCGFGG